MPKIYCCLHAGEEALARSLAMAVEFGHDYAFDYSFKVSRISILRCRHPVS